MENKKNKVFCLMGPTAAGKTALAIELVQRFPFEIISVDSGMIYRGMDIGTAKPTQDELKIAPHRLIDICDPTETYSVGQFRKDAICEIEKILTMGKWPLLVGGTMMYFKMLQEGISNLPEANKDVRAEISLQGEERGWDFLYKKLQQVDPAAAVRIAPTDRQRIQRALEIYEITGKSLSEMQNIFPPKSLPYNFVNVILIPGDKNIFFEKICSRFQKMLRLGFLEEVEKLFCRGDLSFDMPSMRTVGYRQAWNYFCGKITREEMFEQIPIATRQLVKRQLMWLKRWENAKNFECDSKMLFTKVSELIDL